MTVLLPDTAPVDIQWTPNDFGGTLAGAMGGSAQRVNRLGNRWAVSFTLPPLERTQALKWSAALTQGLREGVRWKIWQDKYGPTGSPLVNGASQTGSTVILDGLQNSCVLNAGRFFSIVTGTQRYVYQVAETVAASASGTATVTIEPPLRVSPDDNDVVEFGIPYIDGLLPEAMAWTISVDQLVRGLTVTIEETR